MVDTDFGGALSFRSMAVDGDRQNLSGDADDIVIEMANSVKGGDDDEDEAAVGPDPEEAKIRFTELKEQYELTSSIVGRRGRNDAKSKSELENLGELFKCFKLTPRQFDPLLSHIRAVLTRLRRHERTVMSLAVRSAKMPRKTFIASFPSNEINEKWIDKHIKEKP